MSLRLADRLSAARRRRFVGRDDERALFQSALAAEELPFHVLHIFGPGGVGKTTLLGEFAFLCEQAGLIAAYVDARNVEPSPDSFLGALRPALGLTTSDSLPEFLASETRRLVALIDTYESLAPLDGWLRESFLPHLSENILIVLAGRNPPSPAWRADPGWQALIRTVSLRNLSPDESRAYLAARQIPSEQHRAVADFTHGHPLALSLVADAFDQRPGLYFQPEAAPDVVKALLERFMQKVPGPAHRTALEASALAHVTTEAVLGSMLATPNAHELFEWLRGLSFIESGPLGLFPHDLAREALAADLRWRNPDWYAELHRRAREYYAARLQQTHGREQRRVLYDYTYLHRDNLLVRPFFDWQEGGTIFTDYAREPDQTALAAMVARHEGEEAAQLFLHWFARQPRGMLVYRDVQVGTDSSSGPVGFVAIVALHHTEPHDLELDPAARGAWNYLQRRAPLRPGEGAVIYRFWMAGDTYQNVSYTQSRIFISVVQHYLTTPGLAFTFFPCAEPDFWGPVCEYADLARIPEADFEVGGRHYGVYGHDWRTAPPMAWLALLAEREIAAGPQPTPPPQTAEPLLVLSQEGFAGAVRKALRDLSASRPDVLRANPLLRSRLVVERAAIQSEAGGRVAALQALIKEAAESLQSPPRDARLYRALYHTYLQPAPTQEKAAEILELPFSTYRRHLKAGITRVTEILWQQEIGGLEK